MELKMNSAMNNYDFVEATDFEGLMPAAAEKLGTTGMPEEEVSVRFMGVEAKGMDPLEVVDVEAVLADDGE